MVALTLNDLCRRAQQCVACSLCEGRTQVVFGGGNPDAELMLIGEAPGREEDLTGEPFVGRSGRLVLQLLNDAYGFAREDCYIANVVKCRPPENRNPRAEEIRECRLFLEGQIAAVRPRLVMTLGNVATRVVLSTSIGITRLRGTVVDKDGYLVMPTYHPAAALRSGKRVLDLMADDFRAGARVLRGRSLGDGADAH